MTTLPDGSLWLSCSLTSFKTYSSSKLPNSPTVIWRHSFQGHCNPFHPSFFKWTQFTYANVCQIYIKNPHRWYHLVSAEFAQNLSSLAYQLSWLLKCRHFGPSPLLKLLNQICDGWPGWACTPVSPSALPPTSTLKPYAPGPPLTKTLGARVRPSQKSTFPSQIQWGGSQRGAVSSNSF